MTALSRLRDRFIQERDRERREEMDGWSEDHMRLRRPYPGEKGIINMPEVHVTIDAQDMAPEGLPAPVTRAEALEAECAVGWEAIRLLRLYVPHGKPPCLYPLDAGRCCECEACGAGLSMSPELERALGSALDRSV